MNHIFSKIFFLNLSHWEAGLAASHILDHIEFEADIFEESSAQNIREGVIKLGALPKVWARELVYSILAEGGYSATL